MAVRFLSQQSKSWIDNLSHSLVASVEKGFTRGHISMPAGEATAPGIYMDAVMASLMRVFGDPFKWGLEGFKRKVASQYDSVARQIAARIMLTAKSIVQTSGYHPAITNSSITGGWREITDWALRRRKVRRDPKYKTRPLYDTGSLAASIQLRRDNVRGPVLGGGGNLEGFRAADQFKEDSGASRSSGDYYVVVPAKQTSRGNRINIGMIHEFGSVVPAITPFGVSGVRYIPPSTLFATSFRVQQAVYASTQSPGCYNF